MFEKPFKLLTSEYATFRPEVLAHIVQHLPRHPLVMMDPMAGTAPLIPFVEKNGHTAFFNDILPIHYYLNRAKTFAAFQAYQEFGKDNLTRELLVCMSGLKFNRLSIFNDVIDDAILGGLVSAWNITDNYDLYISTLLKAAIVICVRDLSSYTKTDNPTWFKSGGISSNKDLDEIVRDNVNRLDAYYRHSYVSCEPTLRGSSIFSIHDAIEFRTPQLVDCIITSPPYPNRLDYFVNHKPENYFLAAVSQPVSKSQLMYTNVVKDYTSLESDFEYLTKNSRFARGLLSTIRHSPKSDTMYYLKCLTRYFARVCRNVEAILQNLAPTGKMYFVVQDNIHRGSLIEIDRIVTEVLKAKGYHSRIIKTWERHHLGLRNISRDKAFVKPRQFEKLLVIWP